MAKKVTNEKDNSQFTNQFANIAQDKNPTGPWEHQQPLKPRPKVFPVNDPDMMGG